MILLQARGLQLRFGGVVAADGIDLDVIDGERLAIIGPNGAGKTTFLNICTGYLRPQAGTVTFEGQEITAQPPRDITRLGIARAFQIPQLFAEHTVLENMLLAAASRAPALGAAHAACPACPSAPRWSGCSISSAAAVRRTGGAASCPRASASSSTSRWRWR